ncbi:sensor histidine kinase [Streptomyces olivaceiscleroticus]|uniref:sensor histidine kinase n=1 Tax=Streptomyces olivaceiscleroticus TaxID=68245 RepID=UPI0031F8977B
MAGFTAAYMGRLATHRARSAQWTNLREYGRQVIDAERHRIARDLHDVVGHDLSAIVLRSEVALRHVPPTADPALKELTEVIRISRRSLRDVRRIVLGTPPQQLASTVASLTSLLDSAGVQAEVHIDCQPLPSPVDNALSMVLREGVTNMLKHSHCGRCRIQALREHDRVRLTVANDGVPRFVRRTTGVGGAGLVNLTTRVGSVGGTFTAEVLPGGWFALTAVIPAEHCVPTRPRNDATV